ncbi:unnamed protein product [Fraxinus pennsylvanica]|uniref:Cytochrome P450 n=1 Tax=Fraxinus pennsylvanica TaxID=56036 RepID=A0AAD2DL85_9LAMI|nr:unnamed protein product [Fraxinus pennsylvanica]
MTELLRHSKAMERLENKVRLVVGSKLEITEEDLDKMPYLMTPIKESLRLHYRSVMEVEALPLPITQELTHGTKIRCCNLNPSDYQCWGSHQRPIVVGIY